MYLNRRRQAFTLIELLTVMAIITLLIGILTPALGTARDQARKTSVKAQINAMEVGLEAFYQDEGKYVPSNANYYCADPLFPTDAERNNWEVQSAPNKLLQGAHLLLDALAGRDFLGYDSKAPPFGPGGASVTPYDRWAATNDRRQPYIPVDGVDVTSHEKPPEDAFGGNPDFTEVQPEDVHGPTGPNLICRVFRDKFGWPILYYRASPKATQNSPIIQTQLNMKASDGVYDGLDNQFFTSFDKVNAQHKIMDADDRLAQVFSPTTYGATLANRFAEFIRSIRATTYDTTVPTEIAHPRPVKADRFILLSPGKDGIYGNLDDVGNFNVLSEER
jgi:prepilin-type N-terminal cleavage/methylation domain-containing protein